MLICDQCGDQVPDPAQVGEGLHDEDSRCQHLDCEGVYRSA